MKKKCNCPKCGKELTELSSALDIFSFWCDECDLEIVLDKDEETPVSISDDTLMVEWLNIGEGLCGDYNPDNPEDINLLRFDVSYADKEQSNETVTVWEEVEDASYCTNTPADTAEEDLIRLLYAIFREYRSKIDGYPEVSLKKLGEGLSYISPADLRR